MAGSLRHWLPTNVWVRLAIVPALVFMALATDRNYLQDFWHHLARGRAMVEQGRLVDEDLFTCTVPGIPFRDVNWLTQVGYHYLFEWGGLPLLLCLNALTLAVTFFWLVLCCRRVCGSAGVAAVVGGLTFFGLWEVLTLRPQTFSQLFFVALLDVLLRADRDRRWLVVPPLLLALWANVHGAFLGGVLLVGCFAAAALWDGWRRSGGWLRDPQARALLFCLAATAAATLVSPYGVNVYQFVGNTSVRASLRRIDEWVPPAFDQWVGAAFFASLPWLVGLYAAAWRLGRRPTARELCLAACFLPLACGSVRMVAWWLLVIAPISADLLAKLLPARKPEEVAADARPSLGAGLMFGLFVLALVFCLPPLQAYNPLLRVSRSGPRVEDDLARVHDRLRREGSGNVFSRFEWGAYLSYAAMPGHKIFMDVRIDMYPDEVWDAYTQVTLGGPTWQAVLDRYHVDYLILDQGYHRRTGLLAQVEQSADWQRVCQERDAVLYVRRPEAQARVTRTPATP